MFTKRYGRIRYLNRSITLEQLEERIVLDAAVAVEANSQDCTDLNQNSIEQCQNDEGVSSEQSGIDPNPPSGEDPSDPLQGAGEQHINLALISNALDQFESIEEAVLDGVEVLVYDDAQDDLTSINDAIEKLVAINEEKIGHLAIFSHGATGVLNLGAGEFWTESTLEANPSGWNKLGGLLTDEARIDLYGCNTGAGEDGYRLVSALADLTGVTVWASDDPTGNCSGSDWELEVRAGESTAEYLIDARALDDVTIQLPSNLNHWPEVVTSDPPSVEIDEGETTGELTFVGEDLNNPAVADVHFFVDGVKIVNDSASSVTLSNGSLHAKGGVSAEGGGRYSQVFSFTPNQNYFGEVTLDIQFMTLGPGAFQDVQSLASLQTASLVLTDVDGDGDSDIIEGNNGNPGSGDPNQVYLNDGDGTFTNSGQSLGSSNTRCVAAGDIDGNNGVDFVAANKTKVGSGQDNVIWLNDGTGQYAASSNPASSEGWVVRLGDLGKSALPDMLLCPDGGNPELWFNDGDGSFGNGADVTFSGGTCTAALLYDLDNDNDLDIVLGRSSSAQVWINDNGADTFTAGSSINHGATSMAVGDLNGDSHPDLALAGNFGLVSAWINDGSGGFTDAQSYGLFGSGQDSTWGLTTADFNADGHTDIYWARGSKQPDSVLFNDGAGNFTASAQQFPEKSTSDAVAGDLNGDGWIDLVTANYPNATVYLNGFHEDFSDSVTWKITVHPVNDPPEIPESDVPKVPDFEEDTTSSEFILTAREVDLPDPSEVNFVVENIEILNSGGSKVSVANGTLEALDGVQHDGNGKYTQRFTFAHNEKDWNGTVNLDYHFNSPNFDNGGQAESSQPDRTIELTITPVNDQPTTNGEQNQSHSYTEGDAFVEINNIKVEDVDANEEITATLILSEAGAGELTAGSGNGETYDPISGHWTVTGGLDAANDALAAVRFIPEKDNDVDTTVSVKIRDGMEDGASEVTGTIQLNVTPVNDQPTTNGNEKQTQTYTEGAPAVDLDDIVVEDPDTNEEITATLVLADTGAGGLTANSGNGETYNSGSGQWMITGSVKAVNDALKALQFIPETNNERDTTVSVEIKDGGEAGSTEITGTIQLNVTPVNDQPTTNGNEKQTQTYTEGAPAVDLDDIVVEDPDTNEEITATLVLADTGAGGLTANSGNGETYDSGSGQWMITGSVKAVNDALAGVQFIPEEDNDLDTTVSVEIVDGKEDGTTEVTGTINLNVNPVNDAPTTNGQENQTHTYRPGNTTVELDDIVVHDPDTGEVVTATLTLDNPGAGKLTASSGNGETFDQVAGVWQAQGDVDTVNKALEDVAFVEAPGATQRITIQVEIADGGEDGVAIPAVDGEIELTKQRAEEQDSNGNPAGESWRDNFSAIGESLSTSAVSTTGSMPAVERLIDLFGSAGLLQGFPSYQEGDLKASSGSSPELAGLLHQALFGESSESQSRSWNNLFSFVSGKKPSERGEWLGLEEFLARLKEWRLGKSLDEILLVFNAEEVKLAEWFEALMESTGSLLQNDTMIAGEVVPYYKPNHVLSMVFDIDELRFADILTSKIPEQGFINSAKSDIGLSDFVCRSFDLNEINLTKELGC